MITLVIADTTLPLSMTVRSLTSFPSHTSDHDPNLSPALTSNAVLSFRECSARGV